MFYRFKMTGIDSLSTSIMYIGFFACDSWMATLQTLPPYAYRSSIQRYARLCPTSIYLHFFRRRQCIAAVTCKARAIGESGTRYDLPEV